MRPSGEPWWVHVALAAVLLGALVIFAGANLPSASFWYDEAVQFWISRGADPFGPPGTQGHGVEAVIRLNARDNLDPGGFSLLLHAWTRRRTDPRWLRLLPFGLFLGGLAAMARLGWIWRPRPEFALLGAALPLASPLITYHATEVRAYTMEFAGVVVGCWLLHRLEAAVSLREFALVGLTLAVFMSSRYSYTVFVGAMGLALAPTLWARAAEGGARLRQILVLGVPVLAGVAFVAVNLWLQRGRLTGNGGAYVEYLAPTTAADKPIDALLRAVAVNLLSPVAIPVTLAAVLALVPTGWRAHCPAGLSGFGASRESRAMYRLAPGVLVLSAALWRWHPWDVTRKWSLFLHALSAVLALRMIADFHAWLLPDVGVATRSGRWARAGWLGVTTLAVAGLSLHAATQRRVHSNDLTPALRYLEQVPLATGSVAVAAHPYPVLRYLCEHGPFIDRLPYPIVFRLPYRGGPRPLLVPETRYLITYEGPEALARAYPGIRLHQEAALPANLYAVDAAGS